MGIKACSFFPAATLISLQSFLEFLGLALPNLAFDNALNSSKVGYVGHYIPFMTVAKMSDLTKYLHLLLSSLIPCTKGLFNYFEPSIVRELKS